MITNPEKKNGSLVMYPAAANGRCFDSIFYEDIGARKQIVRILDIPYYYCGDEALKTLVIYNAHFTGKDYSYTELQAEARVFETDADYTVQDTEIKGDILFENKGLVFSVYGEGEKTYFQITNSGADDFQVETYTSNTKTDHDSIWVDVFIPAYCQYDVETQNPVPGADQNLQLECTCYSRPELSFITGLIDIGG